MVGPGIGMGPLAGMAELAGAAWPHYAAEAALPAGLRALGALKSGSSSVPPSGARSAAPRAAAAAPPRRCYATRFGDDEDKAARPATPWVRQVISGVDLMRHPKYNKGLAFSEAERDRLYLRGLLPPAVLSQEVQLERAILNIRSKEDALDKYSYLQSLQNRNERLFYRCARGARLVARCIACCGRRCAG